MKFSWKPNFLFKYFCADTSMLVHIIGSGLLLILGWATNVVPKSAASLSIPLTFGFLIGLVVIAWEMRRAKTGEFPNKPISYISPNIRVALVCIVLIVPINEVRFSTIAVYFAYHIILYIALLSWQRQERKRFRWIDLFP